MWHEPCQAQQIFAIHGPFVVISASSCSSTPALQGQSVIYWNDPWWGHGSGFISGTCTCMSVTMGGNSKNHLAKNIKNITSESSLLSMFQILSFSPFVPTIPIPEFPVISIVAQTGRFQPAFFSSNFQPPTLPCKNQPLLLAPHRNGTPRASSSGDIGSEGMVGMEEPAHGHESTNVPLSKKR